MLVPTNRTDPPAQNQARPLNTEDAASYLGLSPKTLAMYRSKGVGPAYIKRGRIFYLQTDLDQWLQGGRVNCTG